MFYSMAVSSSSSSSLVSGVKYFIQSGFTAWRARHAAEQRRGHQLEEGVRDGEERIVVLERELASVRVAAKTEDAAATLKTCAASETSDRALKESRAERYPREGSLRAPSERSERGEGSLASEKPQRKSAAPTSAQTPAPRRHRGARRRACSTARSTSRGVPRGSAHRRPSESLRAGLPPWRR